MQITESLPRWDRIVETVRANSDTWKDTAPHGCAHLPAASPAGSPS